MRIAAFLAAATMPVAIVGSPFGTAAISDSELAALRGGLRLPNGLDVTLGIAIETSIDGQIALRTMADGSGNVQVFTGGSAAGASQRAAASGDGKLPAAPMVTINRGGAGTVIAPLLAAPNVSVGVSRGAAGAALPGGTALALVPNGTAVDTSFGAVSLEQTARGTVAVLNDPTLQLRHLIGSATGVVVANTADNRAIDTVATVNIELGNATALVGSNLLAIDSIAADAAARSVR